MVYSTLDIVAGKKQIVIGRRVRNSRDWQRVDPEFKKRVLGISVCVLGCSRLVWSDGGE